MQGDVARALAISERRVNITGISSGNWASMNTVTHAVARARGNRACLATVTVVQRPPWPPRFDFMVLAKRRLRKPTGRHKPAKSSNYTGLQRVLENRNRLKGPYNQLVVALDQDAVVLVAYETHVMVVTLFWICFMTHCKTERNHDLI